MLAILGVLKSETPPTSPADNEFALQLARLPFSFKIIPQNKICPTRGFYLQ